MESRRPGQHDVTPFKEAPSQEKLIVYAGQSKRRLVFLQHAFPDSEVTSIPAGEEPDIPDVVSIMHGKIDNIIAQLKENPSVKERKQEAVIIAADTRTSVLTLDQESLYPYLESKGKPKTPDAVRNTFAEMALAAEAADVLPHYTVLSGSGIHIREPRRDERLADIHTCTVELNQDQVEYFSTEEGYRDYENHFRKFYSSEAYTRGGLSGVTIGDLSGGLSLPVLTSLGAVEAVDGIERGSSDFESAFRHGMFTVAVGISPHILRPIQPNIYNSLDSWDWLNGVVNQTLK